VPRRKEGTDSGRKCATRLACDARFTPAAPCGAARDPVGERMTGQWRWRASFLTCSTRNKGGCARRPSCFIRYTTRATAHAQFARRSRNHASADAAPMVHNSAHRHSFELHSFARNQIGLARSIAHIRAADAVLCPTPPTPMSHFSPPPTTHVARRRLHGWKQRCGEPQQARLTSLKDGYKRGQEGRAARQLVWQQ
jgi:hypothetical protein